MDMSDSSHKPLIVICHLREDREVARQLGGQLAAAGAKPWLASPPDELGEDWEDRLETTVRSADAMVVCLRPGFESLAASQEEVKVALRVNLRAPFGPKFLIPYVVEPVEGDRPTELPELIEAINLQCASRLRPPGTPERPPDKVETAPDLPIREGLDSPPLPGGRARYFSAASATPAPNRSWSGLPVALGSVLVVLLLGAGYWYWPEAKPTPPPVKPAQEASSGRTPGLSAATPTENAATEDLTPKMPVAASVATSDTEPGALEARIEHLDSPNQLAGRGGYKPEAVIIHSMDAGLKPTQQWLMNPKSNASMHYAIGLNGQIVQFVQETNTAFHLGRRASSLWPLQKPDVDPNYYTIGVDHESLVGHAWPEKQVEACAALIRQICLRWGIPIDRQHVLGHHEAFPLDIPSHRENLTLKPCPGEGADLDRLVRLAGGVSVPAPPPAKPVESVRGEVTTVAALQIRAGSPSTRSPSIGSVPSGTVLKFVGWAQGQRVQNNAYWYRDPDGNFFWAGGTSRPDPTAF